jgi:hypothetical protein
LSEDEKRICREVELFPKDIYGNPPAKLGRIDGGGFAPMVHEMPEMRL